EDFGFSSEDIFCEDPYTFSACINFDTPESYGFEAGQSGTREGAVVTVQPEDADKVEEPAFGLDNALKLESGNSLQIDFDETALSTYLKISSRKTGDVVIKYFGRTPSGVDYNGLQNYSCGQIDSK